MCTAELCGCLLFVLEGLTIWMRLRNRLYLHWLKNFQTLCLELVTMLMLGATSSLALLQRPKFPIRTKTVSASIYPNAASELKWRLLTWLPNDASLKKPLECEFMKHKVVIFASMILHNFCVDERLLRDPDFRITRADIEPMPLPNPVRGKGYLPSDRSTRPTGLAIIPGASLKSLMIVHTLQLNNILRPSYHIARKQNAKK